MCTSLCVLKTGFLFAASEFGNHGFYQFASMGDDEDCCSSSLSTMETEDGYTPIFFSPRALKNLILIDELESLSPVTDMKITDLHGEDTPQIYTACGRGPAPACGF